MNGLTNVVYPYNGIVFSNEKDQTTDRLCNTDMGEHWWQSKWKKPDTRDCMLHDSISIKCPKTENLKHKADLWLPGAGAGIDYRQAWWNFLEWGKSSSIGLWWWLHNSINSRKSFNCSVPKDEFYSMYIIPQLCNKHRGLASLVDRDIQIKGPKK